ncbi:MAG TPA: LuxR C-terminal-related transcriptional regulator [Longimicrobiales bacterium]|nr:LuxR C-terminal-related transcriptional regulator [Longimicrobiales bacterium]
MNEPNGDAPPRLHLVLALIFLLITVAASADMAMDRPTTLWSVHILAEATLVLVSLGAASYLAWGWYSTLGDVRTLEAAVEERRAERDAWRRQASQALQGLSVAMNTQFDTWELTDAERETALMLLKGFSHKRIGKLTDRSERTVRQHSVAVYRKSGLAGRSELAGFFLEGVLLPARAAEESAGR